MSCTRAGRVGLEGWSDTRTKFFPEAPQGMVTSPTPPEPRERLHKALATGWDCRGRVVQGRQRYSDVPRASLSSMPGHGPLASPRRAGHGPVWRWRSAGADPASGRSAAAAGAGRGRGRPRGRAGESPRHPGRATFKERRRSAGASSLCLQPSPCPSREVPSASSTCSSASTSSSG